MASSATSTPRHGCVTVTLPVGIANAVIDLIIEPALIQKFAEDEAGSFG
jgi:hypothetical protein